MAKPIILESMRGANAALIARVLQTSGTAVAAGQLLFEVENHKVLQEVVSPADGTVVHALSEGDYVPLGVVIAYLAEPGEDSATLVSELEEATDSAAPEWPDMICRLAEKSNDQVGQPVSVAKATEIAVLGNGPAQSLQASLGMVIGPVARSAVTPNFFQDKILDLMVYECSRLMRDKRFTTLNTRFVNGRVIAHDSVTPGISFDDGGRLTLYALADADKMNLTQIQDQIVEGLMRYVARRLDLPEVASSTFTISDVTVAPLNFSVPLVPRDQCMIIVVTRSSGGDYMLNISFDHRLTEGLLVTNFAQELAARIRSYARPEARGEAPHCNSCGRSAEDEYNQFRRRGLLKIVGADGAETLSCATCWEGW